MPNDPTAKTPIGLLLLFACLLGSPSLAAKTPPEGVEPVENFDLQRYLGLWYEIARTDNRFERGLESVTAEYTLKDDGNIRVYNRGWDAKNQEWDEVDGTGKKIGDPEVGSLKVTFFWPFYAGYHVFALDHEGYQYALVSGDNHSYLWILARTPQLPPSTIDALLRKAEAAGFDTDSLIWVEHETVHPSLQQR
ncbi:lipocalin family protein [Pelagicoccus sp. SDUM812005]|uniref:lipocalin family protein n=1 Tax=Pelagicoccus sp. SDUM812005 TaxID=3041257 RepID=UPI00280E0B33|nr:lipocalin family protein [Pelagicoccus sp. SDUM812005]MDQ8179055.1 lipocalin family protein [Pelagicoccus sp. SDUM812005]